jgi:hypothetical protein
MPAGHFLALVERTNGRPASEVEEPPLGGRLKWLETHRLGPHPDLPGPLPLVGYPPARQSSNEHEVVMVTLSPMLIGVVGCL